MVVIWGSDWVSCGQDQVLIRMTFAEAQDLANEIPSTGRMVRRLQELLTAIKRKE